MRIQAVNSVMPVNSCQPVKQVEFARKKSPGIDLSSVLREDAPDITTEQGSCTTEQKYNLACLLAAYYKTQYEQLVQQKECFA